MDDFQNKSEIYKANLDDIYKHRRIKMAQYDDIEIPEIPEITFSEYSTLGLGDGFTPDQQILQLITIIINAIDSHVNYTRNFIVALERYKERLVGAYERKKKQQNDL